MQDEDTKIVQAVQSGDTDAFRSLVERHQAKLHAILLRIVSDPLLAEELAAETFVKAYQSLAGFRGEAKFGTWLVQIGIHAARDHLRRRRRVQDHQVVSLDALRTARRWSGEPQDTRLAANPVAGLDHSESAALLQRALARLPVEYREVLVLKHYEDWSYEQIATLTGDTVGTLKVRAHRARKLMKDKLADLGWEPGGEGATSRAESGRRDAEVNHGGAD